ncbi:NAD(P)-dependent oxidoreductase [Nocardioides mesophilus]|uniref:NAD(P)-dependent oxidoreductase n=1 Tax=Nocardioides mesophilus TaxID=433659 RepID=A0A7G9RG54_9ACTN|nr:NAD(P)-dependent oxidoreductase [Nocardioides mesophilus]QNN54579.1 NAD(P)-dependent oxidoreductase [Nocardioides mesophilus]
MSVVGIIGLGIMGSAMAENLLARGHEVHGTDTSADRVRAFESAGGHRADGPAALATAMDCVITSLPSAEAAEQVCGELAGAGRPGLVVVETSTLSLEVKHRCREVIEASGAVLLDCPLSGTGAQAKVRDVVVFGSGDEHAFESVRPVLEDLSRSVRHLGGFGTGTVMKLVANLLVSIHNASAAEAFALGVRAGLDPQLLYDTVRDGAGGSVIFDKRGPLMVSRDYLPATARCSMFVKDVGLVQELAASVGLETPVLDATLPLYRRAVAAGLADADAAALLDVLDGGAQ